MSKKEKVTDKKSALLNATLSMVNECGFHDAPMSKIAKRAGVAPATIYLYFENKQDLINSLYLEVKESFGEFSFKGYSADMPVKKGFEVIWRNIAEFKLKQVNEAAFLALCANTPMIDEEIRQEALKHLQPLLDLLERGKNEGIIKPFENFILYSFTIYPINFLLVLQKRDLYHVDEKALDEAFQTAWDAIKK